MVQLEVLEVEVVEEVRLVLQFMQVVSKDITLVLRKILQTHMQLEIFQ